MSHSSGENSPLKIGILGTRGIPANYGGFETFAEELSTRLAARGHEVTVYGRSRYVNPQLRYYRGVHIRALPALYHKYLETVSHTLLSSLHTLFRPHDVVLICNGVNVFAAPLLLLRRQHTVLNVDGIERRRRKWSLVGKAVYLAGEYLAGYLPDRVITDARSIQSYYLERYGLSSLCIPYGAGFGPQPAGPTLARLKLRPGGYLLYVSRLEPENNAHLVIDAYLKSGIDPPLVLVGDAPYSRRYVQALRKQAGEGNILMPGAIYGAGYRELLSHCLCYLQATEVGGTHPALVEAMGVGALILANEAPENREVVEDSAWIHPFSDTHGLARLIRILTEAPEQYAFLRQKARERARLHYDWEHVTDRYEELFFELAGHQSRRLQAGAEQVEC